MADGDNEKLRIEKLKLESKLERLYDVVQNALITLDVAIKLGAIVGVWFFPLPTERWPQAIAMAAYAALVTIISKGLNKMKEIKHDG